MSRKQSNITEERILQLVRERPFVFDPKERLYKHRSTHVNGWPYIARDVNLSVERCVRIWERIRKQYTEYLGKQRKNPGKDKLASFRYSQAMEFYRPFYRPYKSKISRVYKESASSGEEDSVRSPINQDHGTNQTISNMIPHNNQVLRNPSNNDSQINFNEFFVNSDRPVITRQADHLYPHHHHHNTPTTQSSSSQPTSSQPYHHHLFPPPPSTPQLQDQPKDEFQLFGDMVALKLRKMQERSPQESVNAQIQILTLLK